MAVVLLALVIGGTWYEVATGVKENRRFIFRVLFGEGVNLMQNRGLVDAECRGVRHDILVESWDD